MPTITLFRSLKINIGRRRKMQAAPKMTTYLYKVVCFFSYKETFIPYSEIFYFAALNKLVYLMEWQYCNRKYTFHVRLIKLWTHAFDSTKRTKLSFVVQWDSGKRSLSTEVKISSNILSGTTSMSKSRNMACLYVHWSRANVIASASYKQFSSVVERGEMRCENPQRPLGSYN